MPGLLLIFLDGVGIGEADARTNPFFAAPCPTLASLVGAPPSTDAPVRRGRHAGRGAVAFPVDATLGVEGTPQSGTGQATLLTGRNGAVEFGRHFGPWIPTPLRPAVREENLLVRARDAGHSVRFANAYPPDWPGDRARRRVAGPPLAALGAGLLTRHADHLAREEALTSEIVNDGWIRHLGPENLPRPTPVEAGRTLARLASGAELTLFAHYTTDTAGHARELPAAVDALERVDAFLAGVLEGLSDTHRVLVVSDHGNLEDTRVGHTRNPALGLLVDLPGEARAAERVNDELVSLLDVPRVALGLLD